jgi:hypothetical protein
VAFYTLTDGIKRMLNETKQNFSFPPHSHRLLFVTNGHVVCLRRYFENCNSKGIVIQNQYENNRLSNAGKMTEIYAFDNRKVCSNDPT